MRRQKIFRLMMMKGLDSEDLEQVPLGIGTTQFPILILPKKGELWIFKWTQIVLVVVVIMKKV